MMYKKMMIGLSLAAAVFSVSAQNLIPMPVSVRLDSQPGVKYVADKTANTQKMLVEKYSQDKDGNLCIQATLYFSGFWWRSRRLKALRLWQPHKLPMPTP